MADLEKFDASKYAEAIREKIKGAIIDVIPNEQWDAMILAEMKKFMDERYEGSGYHRHHIPSGAQEVIQSVLMEDVKSRTKKMLESPEWNSYWDQNTGRIAGEKITEFMEKNGTVILNNWLGSMMQSFIDQLKYRSNT